MARSPDFFVIGHPKCGTTALYAALRRHPDIFMSTPKEPHYLATELRHRPEFGTFGGLPKSEDDYLRLFAGAAPGQIAGEASAWYLWSATAAAEIAALAPQARIVALLREPVAFVRSLHLQCVQAHIEPENDLRKAFYRGTERRPAKAFRVPPAPRDWPQILPAAGGLSYAGYVRYVEQLDRYSQLFSDENILVLAYDDFRADNDAVLSQVLDFIGADKSAPLKVSQANPTVRVRSARINNLFRATYMGEGTVSRKVKAAAKTLVPNRRLRRLAIESAQHKLLFTEPQPIDEEFANELRRQFSIEVIALSERLDRDFVSLWGYDNLA